MEEGDLVWKAAPGRAGRAVTEAAHAPGAGADPVRQARLGVPPDVLGGVLGDGGWDDGGAGAEALPCPVPLTSAEVEVLLCFALTSPLHYGPVEEGLCDKLRRHLYGSYARQASAG